MNSSIKSIEYFEKFGSILGLERISELLYRLGNPQKNLKVIHIAGTNGKGSVSRYIYEILRDGGYSVGIYTSPYLEVFNERIEVDDIYIPDDSLERLLEKVTQIAKEIEADGKDVPTEFDIITAVAFMYFREKNVDYVVLEVGLGGRLDSTNIVESPLISVITSISLDHTDRIGKTVEEIAFEKGGIIKNNIPVVIGKLPKEAQKVIEEKAEETNSEVILAGGEYNVKELGLSGSKFFLDILGKSVNEVNLKEHLSTKGEAFEISMIGRHQVDNSVVAIRTVEKLIEDGKVALDIFNIKNGILKSKNKGRFEVIENYTNPKIILDGAHNEAGMMSFADTLIKILKEKTNLQDCDKIEIDSGNKGNDKDSKNVLVVCGFLKDKDIGKMANILGGLRNLVKSKIDFIATEPNNPRKLEKEAIAEILSMEKCNVIGKNSAENIVNEIIGTGKFKDYEMIVFVGSLYLIGDVRKKLVR